MKRRDLIKKLAEMGCDWYTNRETEQSQAVPRHNEIDEFLAKTIIKKLSK